MFNFKNTRLAFDLVTISHTVFVLPLIFSGYLFISKEFVFIDLLLITIASFGARNIAFIFNRYTDREIDKKNPRTLSRPIPSGKTSDKFLISFLILSFLIFIIPSLILCKSTLYLIPIPIILFYIYPFLKRFTYLCHHFLGLVLSLSPLAGFYVYNCSTLNILDMLPLSLFTFFWISGFDILYALQDYESDIKNKIFSIPSYFGKKTAILISFISFIFAVFLLSHYQTIIFDRSIFGKSIILFILVLSLIHI